MKQEDVEEVIEIWGLIGLHESLETIETFMQIDPEGFAVAVTQETGMFLFPSSRAPNDVPMFFSSH